MTSNTSQKISSLLRFSHILGIILFTTLLCSTGSSVEIAPDKEIVVVGDESKEPAWKRKWDTGREYTRNQQYEKAIPYYLEVLKLKPNIEEVKWELCRVYMETAQYDEASLLLDSLLESNPNRIEYLLSAGDIAKAEQKHNQAVLFFGRALEQDPGSKYYSRALGGMIDSLIGEGKHTIAIPLMEQLYQSGGTTPELLKHLAQTLSQAGELKKSGYYYRELIGKYRVSAPVMHQAASVFEKLGDMDSAAALWESYLVYIPKSHQLRQKLTEYYLTNQLYQKAYPHLVILLDNDINRDNYLLQAGRINLTTFGRPDKALTYFESYYAEYPEGEDVSEEIENIRLILANNLLSIVDNTGVWMLWTDLAKITTDRIGIYVAMADILEALNKDKELIEVLQIIIVHKPEDLQIRLRLASLYFKKNLYLACLETLNREKNYQNLTADYFQLRMSCEKAMNDIPALMTSYKAYLNYFPAATDVRKQSLQLAGEIGDYSSIRELLADYRNNADKKLKLNPEVLEAGINAYINNRLYSEADQFISEIETFNETDSATDYMLMRQSARIKYLQGRIFASEQELRIATVKSSGDLNVILDLTGNALNNNDIAATQVWMPIARKTLHSMGKDKDLTDEKTALLYYSLKLDQLTGDFESMRERAEKYLKSIAGNTRYRMYDREILMMLIADYFHNSSSAQYREIVSSYFTSPLNGWIAAELKILTGTSVNGEKIGDLTNGIQIRSTGDIFDLYNMLLFLKATTRAEQLLDYLEDRLGESVRLKATRAELYIEQYEYAKAAQKYRELLQQFPGEEYFYRQMVKYEEYSGRNKVISGSATGDTIGNVLDRTGEQKAKDTPEYDLEKARTMWLEDNEQEALSIYNNLELTLRNSVQVVLKEVEHKPEYQPDESTFLWSGFTGTEEDIKLLDHIMSPSFFSSHLGDKIALRTAETYANYRWLKIVAKEQKAKQALNRKKFYQAEKRYQELLEEEAVESVNVYTDLATVYDRLGRHAKETELLEKIKHQQIIYPQLQSVVEKNINRRRPQLYVDGLFRKEDGRDGDIDIKQQYFGLGLQIQPTLYQEIGFKAGRNIYGNSQDSSLLTSNLLSAHHSIFFSDDYELTSRIGFEDIKEEGNAYFIYDITLTGKLADSVDGYVSIDQNLVSDTIASLAQGVYKRDYRVGLDINFFPRIFLGFDVTLSDYNDDNDGKRIHLWSSYRIFSDVSSFELTYDYDKLENEIDSSNDTVLDGDGSTHDLGYWSPGNYWKHSLTAKLRRELWPPGKRQSGNSFITAQYGIGYEAGDNLVQKFGIDIFLEISTPFLLKGTFVSDWSDDYNRKEAYATFIYRW